MDLVHEFKGYGVHPSQCRVRVFADDRSQGDGACDKNGDIISAARRLVVILTDLGRGTSVTNAAAQIATEILPMIVGSAAERDNIRWVEHYPADSVVKQDSFDAITFGHYDKHGPYYARNAWNDGCSFSGTYWHRISRGELEELIGAKVQL